MTCGVLIFDEDAAVSALEKIRGIMSRASFGCPEAPEGKEWDCGEFFNDPDGDFGPVCPYVVRPGKCQPEVQGLDVDDLIDGLIYWVKKGRPENGS